MTLKNEYYFNNIIFKGKVLRESDNQRTLKELGIKDKS